MKADHIINIRNMPHKKLILGIKLDPRQIAFETHDAHGFTPNFVR
jgi:hypothetical protein